MSRSASTFSLSDSSKSSAVVQRSNSLDHPPVRARVPVCIRTPCSPVQSLANSPIPDTAPKESQSLAPSYYPSTLEPKSILHAPLSTEPQSSLPTLQQSTSSTPTTSIPTTRNATQVNSKSSCTVSAQHVSRHLTADGCQPKVRAPHAVCVKGRTFSESCGDPKDPFYPRRMALSSPRRETLL